MLSVVMKRPFILPFKHLFLLKRRSRVVFSSPDLIQSQSKGALFSWTIQFLGALARVSYVQVVDIDENNMYLNSLF
jgi:hypothetical protein